MSISKNTTANLARPWVGSFAVRAVPTSRPVTPVGLVPTSRVIGSIPLPKQHHCLSRSCLALGDCAVAAMNHAFGGVMPILPPSGSSESFYDLLFSQASKKDFLSRSGILSATALFLHSSFLCFSFNRFSAAACSAALSLAAGFAAGPITKG